MLRRAAVAAEALRMRVSQRAISSSEPVAPDRCPSPRFLVLSRGYARMMRRSPPVRPISNDESESEAVEEAVLDLDTDGDGAEYGLEDLEGFMLDFGADGGKESGDEESASS